MDPALDDHLDEFVEHAAADTDGPGGMRPGAVARQSQRTLHATAARRVDVEIVGHVRRYEQLVALAQSVVEASGRAQAEHVPIAHQLDGRARMVGDHDLGLAVGTEHHVLAGCVGDEAAGMDPLGVLNAAAIGPVAADHVTAIDRSGEAARHAVAGNRDVGPAGEDLLDAFVLDVDGERRAFHVVADDAPAGRGVCVSKRSITVMAS